MTMNPMVALTQIGKVLVYPEYSGSQEYFRKKSTKVDGYVIGSWSDKRYVWSGIYYDGCLVDSRAKTVLTENEKDSGLEESDEDMRPFIIGGHGILAIICYEICFPPKWWSVVTSRLSLVIHHIGCPMYNVFQLEGWRALEEVVVRKAQCNMIVSCGGKDGPMNLSRVIEYSGE